MKASRKAEEVPWLAGGQWGLPEVKLGDVGEPIRNRGSVEAGDSLSNWDQREQGAQWTGRAGGFLL